MKDETEQLKEALKRQQEYIEMLEAAIELSMMGYVICDAEGNVLKINEAQGQITGWNAEEMLGRNMKDIGKVDDHITGIMQIIETKQPVILERQLATGKNFLVYGKPYFDEQQQLKYAICNLVDTTEITNTKNELEKAKRHNKQLSRKVRQLQSEAENGSRLIFNSQAMLNTVEMCRKVAHFDSTVLILGESGVGKELIADLIHKKSNRYEKPYIKLNCASIPEALLESELFGYEQGSFTGASSKGKKGLLECADQGTVLLDEIGEMPLPLQAKLLRFLQEGEFYRVGGHNQVKLDVRVLGATNRDLWQMVQQGTFREDLFYRLNVISVKVPSLNERREDIPLLITFFNNQFNQKYGLDKRISPEIGDYFRIHPPKGNVRELQNIIERLLVLSNEPVVKLDEMERILGTAAGDGISESAVLQIGKSYKEIVGEFEKELLKQYVREFQTTQKIGEVLKVSQPTISRKLAKYGLRARDMQN